MAKFFNNNAAVQQRSQREILYSRFHSARHNLLLVMVFSLINIVLLVTNSGTYFLFSAFIPYLLVDYGMFGCGLYPAEYYEAYYPGMEFADMSFIIVCSLIAAVVLILYLLSWIFSKKPRIGWMIAALTFFVIDTVVMLFMMADLLKSIVDIVFHCFVIFSLVRGIVSYFKLKKLPEDADLGMDEPQAQDIAVENTVEENL